MEMGKQFAVVNTENGRQFLVNSKYVVALEIKGAEGGALLLADGKPDGGRITLILSVEEAQDVFEWLAAL